MIVRKPNTHKTEHARISSVQPQYPLRSELRRSEQRSFDKRTNLQVAGELLQWPQTLCPPSP
jgi:hypothetical protein